MASDIFMIDADTEAHLTLNDQPLTRLADLAEDLESSLAAKAALIRFILKLPS